MNYFKFAFSLFSGKIDNRFTKIIIILNFEGGFLMRVCKNKLTLCCFVMFLFCFIIGFIPLATAISEPVGVTISDWVLDENLGYIYAVSTDANALFFIGMNDLQIKKQLALNSGPSDLDLAAGKLYIPLSGSKQVVIVDTAAQIVERTIFTQKSPVKVAVDGSKLFYAESGSVASGVYAYNLVNNTEEKTTDLYTNYSSPDLAIDRANHVLYIAEDSYADKNIVAIRTQDYVQVSRATYGDWTSDFYLFERRLIVDGDQVFCAQRSFNRANLAEINGEYRDGVIYVRGDYVFSRTAVYDRNRFVGITSLPVEASLALMDSQNNVYLFDPNALCIRKETLNLNLDPSMQHQYETDKVTLDESLTDWVFDETNGRIYAVSEETNRLLYIRANDLTVEAEKYIGSRPSDIDLYNGTLYIALAGATKVAVTGTDPAGTVSAIITCFNPYRIEVGPDQLFYTQEMQGCHVAVQQISTGQFTEIFGAEPGSFSSPELLFDGTNNLLYIAESACTGSDIYTIRTTDFTQVDRTTYRENYGFDAPLRRVIADRNTVFYEGCALNGANLAEIYGEYDPKNPYENSYYYYSSKGVIHVQGNYVYVNIVAYDRDLNFAYANTAIYDREKFVKLADLPVPASLAFTDSQNVTYLYDPYGHTITKQVFNPSLDISMRHQYSQGVAILDEPLTEWVYDETRDYIYAISEETNKLLYIRGSDLIVEGEKYIGSQPTDIKLFNGNLYIALCGSTRVAVTGTAFDSPISLVNLNFNPYLIEVDQDKLYYTEEDQWCRINVYNFDTGQIQDLYNTTHNQYYLPDLALDLANNLLYIGETGLTGSKVYTIRTSDLTEIDRVASDGGLSMYNPYRKTIFTGGSIYWETRRFDASRLPNILGSYGERFIAVSGNQVFCPTAIYRRDTYQKEIVLPYNIDLAAQDGLGRIYLYSKNTNMLRKYEDLSRINPVTGISLDYIPSYLETWYPYNLYLTAYYSDGQTAQVEKNATYQVSDPTIATVSPDGVITGMNPGTTQITASFQGQTATATVVVVPCAVTPTPKPTASPTPTPVPTPSPTPVPPLTFSDGFDDENFTTGGWTNNGCDFEWINAYWGYYSCRFSYSDSLTKGLSTTGYSNIQVKYMLMTSSFRSGDHFIVEWYDGLAWNELEDVTADNAWTAKTWSLPASAWNNGSFMLRFRAVLSKKGTFAYLDEVDITGVPLGNL
jgi:hypothetical protein